MAGACKHRPALRASHSGRQTQFFLFTILFITISVLFSCKGIQQKLLKRSCPQNGAARLPFLGVPHVLLVPRAGEPGGTVYRKVSSPGSHRGRRAGPVREGCRARPSQGCPWSGGWGLGWPPPRTKLHPSLPASARAKPPKTRAAKDSPSSGSQDQPSGVRGLGGGGEGRASTKCLVRGGARSTTSSPCGGAFLVGRWEAGLPYTCTLQEPPSGSPSRKAAWGGR